MAMDLVMQLMVHVGVRGQLMEGQGQLAGRRIMGVSHPVLLWIIKLLPGGTERSQRICANTRFYKLTRWDPDAEGGYRDRVMRRAHEKSCDYAWRHAKIHYSVILHQAPADVQHRLQAKYILWLFLCMKQFREHSSEAALGLPRFRINTRQTSSPGTGSRVTGSWGWNYRSHSSLRKNSFLKLNWQEL